MRRLPLHVLLSDDHLVVICGRLLSSAIGELGAGELPGGGGELCTWICTRVAECQGS